jgi:hypothetical protein
LKAEEKKKKKKKKIMRKEATQKNPRSKRTSLFQQMKMAKLAKRVQIAKFLAQVLRVS